jgi:lipocalin-like protein
MNRRSILSISAITALGLVLLPSDPVAQQKSLKEELVGTWMLVSSDTVQANGTRSPTFGPNPKGIAVFGSGGHYALEFTDSSLPKFAANNRTTGTAEENKAVVQGSLAHFGTYTVSESDRSLTLHVESSSFPNWTGTEQKRTFTIASDELKWITPAASGGGLAELVWKRAK